MVKEMATGQKSITPSVASRASPSPYPRLPAVFALPLLAIAVSLVLQIEPAQRGFMLALALAALGFTANVLSSAAYLLVAGAVAPAWRKRSYWLIALIVWPLASYLIMISAGLVLALIPQSIMDPQSITVHLNFAGVIVRQCVVFGFIGYWLDKENKKTSAEKNQCGVLKRVEDSGLR